MTTTGYEKRIHEANPALKKGKVQRLAARMAKRSAAGLAEDRRRIQEAGEETWFFEQLRVLGIYRDDTAAEAIMPRT